VVLLLFNNKNGQLNIEDQLHYQLPISNYLGINYNSCDSLFVITLTCVLTTFAACNMGVLVTELLAKVNKGLDKIPEMVVAIKVTIKPSCKGLSPGKSQRTWG
jgi:hypothetical protein